MKVSETGEIYEGFNKDFVGFLLDFDKKKVAPNGKKKTRSTTHFIDSYGKISPSSFYIS